MMSLCVNYRRVICQEISRNITETESVLKQYETRASEAMSQVQRLENALLVCKEEPNVYMRQYSTRQAHEQELQGRDKQARVTGVGPQERDQQVRARWHQSARVAGHTVHVHSLGTMRFSASTTF